MYHVRKNINGHTMIIQFWQGQGGELEDLALWCTSCDPEGNDLTIADVRKIDKVEGMKMLITAATIHSELSTV